MADTNSLTGRLSRYARVGGTGLGLAAQMGAARLFGGAHDKAAGAAQLRAALGGLKGPVMKIAQIIATIPDAVPPEYAAELAQLQSNAPAMGWPFVRRRMKSELGPDWEGNTRASSTTPPPPRRSARSTAPRATTVGDWRPSCNIPTWRARSKPTWASSTCCSASTRASTSRSTPAKSTANSPTGCARNSTMRTRRRTSRCTATCSSGEATTHLPEVLPELSTRRLLTMTWLDGRPLLDFKGADQGTRDRIAENLFRAWYLPLHHFGVIHGDPHLGNYTVRDDLGINLLDFGCVRVFPPRFIGGVVDLYRALQSGDEDLAVDAFERWGFTGLSREIIDTLLIWAKFLYGPLLDDRARVIDASGNPASYGRETAAKVHRRLRELGTVTVPREFVFMDRAAIGLGGVFMHLKAELNWYALFNAMIEGFDEAVMADKQAAALGRAGFL